MKKSWQLEGQHHKLFRLLFQNYSNVTHVEGIAHDIVRAIGIGVQRFVP